MTDNLAAALAEFQRRLPRVDKTGKATVPTKTGGSYTYTYAGLDGISEIALPLLGELGLAFTSRPTLTDRDRFVLAYELIHASGEVKGGEYPLPAGGTPQEIGSAITYGRRYSLCAVTGIAPSGEDDDGRAATVAARRPPNEYTVARPGTPHAVKRSELVERLAAAGIEGKDLALAYISETLDREVASTAELSPGDIVQVEGRLDEEAALAAADAEAGA